MLFTVNLDNAVLKATYSFEKLLKRVEALFENRALLGIKRGGPTRFVDDYQPFDTHVFRLGFDESASLERAG